MENTVVLSTHYHHHHRPLCLWRLWRLNPAHFVLYLFLWNSPQYGLQCTTILLKACFVTSSKAMLATVTSMLPKDDDVTPYTPALNDGERFSVSFHPITMRIQKRKTQLASHLCLYQWPEAGKCAQTINLRPEFYQTYFHHFPDKGLLANYQLSFAKFNSKFVCFVCNICLEFCIWAMRLPRIHKKNCEL